MDSISTQVPLTKTLTAYIEEGLGVSDDADEWEVVEFFPLPAGWVNLYSDETFTVCPGMVKVHYFDNGFDGDHFTFEPGSLSEDPNVRGIVPAWAVKDGRYQTTRFTTF